MQLQELEALLTRTPVALQAHPATLAYLPPDVEVAPSAPALLARLDMPAACQPVPLLTFDTNPIARARLPLAIYDADPYTEALNDVLAARYDTVAAHTLRQRQIADRIVAASATHDIIVLLLIDGLSYRDVRGWPTRLEPSAQLLPCLAEAPTITRHCFPAIIGTPPLAARLFDAGFTNRVGFSYWHRENNALTDHLFATIHNVRRCGTMKDVLSELGAYLQVHSQERIYVQIVRVGLDAGAHHMRELPPVAALLDQLFDAIQALTGLLARTRRRAALYVTSDHGILWRDEFTPEVVGNAQGSARYAHWSDVDRQQQNGLRFDMHNDTYYVLPYPLLRRRLRSDEAGTHGGISFQESIVPFLSVEVHPC